MEKIEYKTIVCTDEKDFDKKCSEMIEMGYNQYGVLICLQNFNVTQSLQIIYIQQFYKKK